MKLNFFFFLLRELDSSAALGNCEKKVYFCDSIQRKLANTQI